MTAVSFLPADVSPAAPIVTAGVLFAASVWISPLSGAENKGARMELKSSAFTEGANIPRKHTCDAEDVSPLLRWGNVPPGTKAFVLIADDPDAPVGTWVHWVIHDLPAENSKRSWQKAQPKPRP